jgi:hypothetical protein
VTQGAGPEFTPVPKTKKIKQTKKEETSGIVKRFI